ncbi:MAG: hydrogenase formation protein HypD [bacterium]|nr:hydrogenase formation protein HypD [bacterium]
MLRLEKTLKKLEEISKLKMNIMEVCGTHTVQIARTGLRTLLPKNIRMLSGPGCPVCVTSQSDVDRIIRLAFEDVTVLTFGDMLHVPGTNATLIETNAIKGNIKVVYSPYDVIPIALNNPQKEFVFIAVGFETTAPAVASMTLKAKELGLRNLKLACFLKLVPPALRAILEIKERKIHGFILPGHVSTIIGIKPYEFIAKEFNTPCVISGFNPEDIVEALIMLVELINSDRADVLNQYKRSVEYHGNIIAKKLIYDVFEVTDANWRGIGVLEDSGLKLKDDFLDFDAFVKFSIPEFDSKDPYGCRCGDVLLGKILPYECPLFSKVCSVTNPIGPCMVSSEGACAAYYNYAYT